MRARTGTSRRARILALAIVLFLLLLMVPSLPKSTGTANFGAGPYTLNMHFSELPRPWFGGSWWDSNWTSRQKLSFDTQSLTEDLTDFPVLIALNGSRIDYANTQDAGEDIRFVDADGTTLLNHEIERWNESGTSFVWVRVPLIDGGSTTDHIWMYYNNSLATDAQNPASVWSNGYAGVWHLSEDPSSAAPQMMDSTPNSNHGNIAGAMISTDSLNAKIGNGLRLDGVDDLINVSDSASLDSTNDEGTFELWLKWTNASDGDRQNIMSSSNRFTTGNEDGYEWASQGDGDHFFYPWGGDINNCNLGPNPFTDGVWHHLAVTLDYSKKEVKIYVDNTPMLIVQENVSTLWTTLASPDDWLWGGNPDRPTRYFDGVFDEIRVSNVVRSSDWSTAQHRSMTDTFVTFGGAQSQYLYRKEITITPGSSDLPPGYAVSTVFDHAALVAAGKSQADGDDIRVIYWDSAEWVEIDRFLDSASSWNDNSTRIWFALYRGIEVSTSDGGYYLYYGNTKVSNPPTNVSIGSRIKSVQSGTAVNAANGITTVSITQVDMSKAFLIFNTRHNGNRPVSSELAGRIATPTSLEFGRSTNETSPITIQWYVIEYYSGVRVQRGEIPSQTSTAINVPINPIASVQQAFVTWSKTPASSDVNWSSDDPVLGELTNTTNLQFRVYGANSGHSIWWQVVEFTNPVDIFVQRGSITTMTGTNTSVNATLSVPVDVTKTFVLVGFRIAGGGPRVGANMLRAQLINSTTIMIDRCISGPPNDITEISWQVVELRDGSRVLAGSENIGPGVNQKVVPLPIPVDINRSVAFASVQPASGQNMGRSPYVGDDITGVGSVTMALSATDITMERDNSADEADIGWFAVEFEREKPAVVVGPEGDTGNVQMTASVHHTRPDGSDPQEIVTSPLTTIDSRTPNPFALTIGSGAQLNFTDSDPRLLRLEINVVNINGGERFALAYGSVAQPTNLDTPANSSNILYLHDANMAGMVPSGKRMNNTMGSNVERVFFDTPGQGAFWYEMLWSPPTVSILNPVQNQHITGTYAVVYTTNPSVANVFFEYHNGTSWTFLGYDADVDGTYQWDSCSVGDGVVTLRAVAMDPLNNTIEDAVSGIEIDCTPPSIQILQPTDYSVIDGNVTITYAVDPDAVMVEIRYDDGVLHTIATEMPPDGNAVWDVNGLTLSGAILKAMARDEVGLTSETEVVGLSTPELPAPTNQPPTISGVPDIVVHYDYSYNFDLAPYIRDEDNSSDELMVWTSDSAHIWESPENNLGIVMNYPQSMLGETLRVTIWVTDNIGTDFQVINVTISEDYPPEKLRPLPDVSFNEDEMRLNVFFTNLDYYFLDVDGDNLYYTSGNASVRIRINSNNTVDMWATEDWFGFEIITIRATDPTAALVEDVVIVQVNPVNDAPVIEEIPEIHVWGGKAHTIDLFEFIHDIDSPMESLSVTTDSEYAEANGFNLTLTYPRKITEEFLTITVSDGIDSTMRMVKVVVHLSQDDWPVLWVIMLAALVNALAWAVYIVNRPKIYAGFLLRENGSLIKEISLTRKQAIPYGLISERVRAKGMAQVRRLDFDRYRVSMVHGKRLHLAVVSSPHVSQQTIAKLQGSIQGLDTDQFDRILIEGDETQVEKYLCEFETTFKRISRNA